MVMRLRQALRLAAPALVAGAVLTAAAPIALAGDEEALFGPRYHSVSVTKDGEPKSLVADTKLRVEFFRNVERDELAWHAGCNRFGYRIIVSQSEIDTRYGASTEIGCPRDLANQDDFFARFFKQDPAWSAEGRYLTLSTERVTVELRRRSK